ncbi:TetR/AcrR family transcriptional regulator [Arcanobacterium haemolyticum]|nr:TetR/AcrR family transcriptional regulator [Arcanobacterium haemolyticum]
MTHEPMRRPKRSDVREAVIAAAAHAFEVEGYDNARLDRIAAEAGFTKGAIYSNFGSKLALFLEVIERRFDTETGGILDVIGAELATPPESQTSSGGELDAIIASFSQQLAQVLDEFVPFQVAIAQFRARARLDPEVARAYGKLHKARTERIVDLCATQPATSHIARERLVTFTEILINLVGARCLEMAARPEARDVSVNAEIFRLALQGVFHD